MEAVMDTRTYACPFCNDRRRISVPAIGTTWEKGGGKEGGGCYFDTWGCFSVWCPECAPMNPKTGLSHWQPRELHADTIRFLADWIEMRGERIAKGKPNNELGDRPRENQQRIARAAQGILSRLSAAIEDRSRSMTLPHWSE